MKRTLTEDDWADVIVAAYDRMPDAEVAVVLMGNGHNVGCHSFPGEVLTHEDTMIRMLVGFVCHLATANNTSPLRIAVGLTSVLEQLVSAGRVVTRPNADGLMVTGVAGPNGESTAGPGGVGFGVIEGGGGDATESAQEEAIGALLDSRVAARTRLHVIRRPEPE